MPTEFIQTGQTFTGEGDAFCPVERKRRGIAGVATSIAVLFVGAGFLTYSVMTAPTAIETSKTTSPRTTAGEETVKIKIDTASRDETVNISGTGETAETKVGEPQSAFNQVSDEEIAAALDAARSARADIAMPKRQRDGLTPSLKPAIQIGEVDTLPGKDGLTPSLKPGAGKTAGTKTPVLAQTAGAVAINAPAPRARPVEIGGVFLASSDDAPPPIFFASDLARNENVSGPAAVLYASDLHRPHTEALIRITRGETFVDALRRAGIGASDRNEAAYAFGDHYNLRQLRPGQEFELTLGWPNQTLFQLASADDDGEARLIGLDFKADPEKRISIRRDHTGNLTGVTNKIDLTTRVMSVAGRIEGSLYMSAKAKGATDKVIADLANTFAYDVDFQREIFGGDEFEAIFEAKYDDEGNLVSSGEILYARLHWRGRNREKGYFRYEDSKGILDYYDASGQSAKRLLMKTPIDGARLSSRFGTRKHPILGYRRAHKGVDFAASRGTPIKAAGDGVVERADRYGSFGNYVRIRHANGYKTAYAHLKGFRRGVRKGKRVRQGDIIGYVGTTGRSTGPHLHYEVHLNGKAVNPQRLKIATGKKLKGAERDRFMAQRDFINAMRLPPPADPSLYAEETGAEKSAL